MLVQVKAESPRPESHPALTPLEAKSFWAWLWLGVLARSEAVQRWAERSGGGGIPRTAAAAHLVRRIMWGQDELRLLAEAFECSLYDDPDPDACVPTDERLELGLDPIGAAMFCRYLTSQLEWWMSHGTRAPPGEAAERLTVLHSAARHVHGLLGLPSAELRQWLRRAALPEGSERAETWDLFPKGRSPEGLFGDEFDSPTFGETERRRDWLEKLARWGAQEGPLRLPSFATPDDQTPENGFPNPLWAVGTVADLIFFYDMRVYPYDAAGNYVRPASGSSLYKPLRVEIAKRFAFCFDLAEPEPSYHHLHARLLRGIMDSMKYRAFVSWLEVGAREVVPNGESVPDLIAKKVTAGCYRKPLNNFRRHHHAIERLIWSRRL